MQATQVKLTRSGIISLPTIIKTLAIVVGFSLFMYVTLIPLAAHVESAGSWLATNVGLWGVGLYVYVVDTLILPASTDLLFPFVLQWSTVPLLVVISSASVLAGISGYTIGHVLSRIPLISRRTQVWGRDHIRLLERHGMWTVAAAAVLPLPFSSVSWLAGILHIRFTRYLLGALFRIPRMIITFWLLREGLLLLR